MRKRNFCILPILACFVSVPAFAGWQYDGIYLGDGWYQEDGARFVLSLRGGASYGLGAIQNDAGAIVTEYYLSPDKKELVTKVYYEEILGAPSDWYYAGLSKVSDIPPSKDYDSFSFAAGASIGWTFPYTPQWRIEAGWDHIVKSDYNASPMFSGDVTLSGGEVGAEGVVLPLQSGSVNSELTTDVISVMAFYDFYDGLYKPLRQAIPYVGFGIGYADSKTVLNLSDPFGDIAYQLDLAPYGEVVDVNGTKMIEFYKSTRHTSNVAGLLAAGMSYGINDRVFLDFGARLMYIPRVKWGLTNVDDTRHREFFSAKNMIYANVMLGIRFEF
ncbi:MAG: hypothetical protein IKZ34_03850 [Alphaproteobacteria bacterium]|nr:hypothetical protein [Alphaproteobacteria bacterium]